MIGCSESNTTFDYFTALITIGSSSLCHLVVSHCPLCLFPASSHPWCVSGRYFRGWAAIPTWQREGKAAGERHGVSSS